MNRFLNLAVLLSLMVLWPGYVRADQADDYLHEQMEKHRIPGVALMVIQEGQPVKTTAYGLADLEQKVPVTPETVFEIGSITKQFTAAGILILCDEGKLSLDDPITKHIKSAPPAWTNITLRHLATHTSGLKNYTGQKGFALTEHVTQEQFVERAAALKPDFQPGESWKYSNTGFNLLGYVIENVSGKPYWEFMQERVFGPLEMSATGDRLPGRIIPNRAHGYEQTNQVHINRDYDLTEVFSAGAIASTVGDLSKWSAALDDNKFLSAKSKTAAWTPAQSKDGKAAQYGLGWFLDQVEGHKNIGHGGSTSGFSASIQRFPEDHVVVILLTNTDEQIATTLAKKVATFYFKGAGK